MKYVLAGCWLVFFSYWALAARGVKPTRETRRTVGRWWRPVQGLVALLFIAIGAAYAMIHVRGSATRWALVLVGLVMASCIGVAIFAMNFDRILGPLRRPEAITGRMSIWPATASYIHDHPWAGTGFGSFWNIGPESPSFQYGHDWVANLGNGHNGYLDLLAQIGIPGLTLVLLAVVFIPIGKLLAKGRMPRQPSLLVLAVLIFAVCHNATETSLFDRDAIVEVFLMLSLAMMSTLSPSDERGRPRRVRSVPRRQHSGGAR